MDTKPLPPWFLGIYNLSTSDLGCNAPYMVNNFLVLLAIACSSHFLQVSNAAEYLNRDTAQVSLGLVYITRLSLEVLDKIHKERRIFCASYGRVYIANRNTRVVHLYEDILHLLQSSENILFDNIISYFNCDFVMHPLP